MLPVWLDDIADERQAELLRSAERDRLARREVLRRKYGSVSVRERVRNSLEAVRELLAPRRVL